MGKKRRRGEKIPKKLKTREERKLEMDTIKNKLTSLGLTSKISGIDIFYEKMEEFIERGESWSGKIRIVGCKRILDIILTPYKHKDSLAALLYDKNI